MTTTIYNPASGGSPTAAQDPLWELNTADTSQFEGADAFASAGCSMALSTVASSTVVGGRILRVAGTVNAGGIAVRLLNQTFPFTSEQRRLRFEIDVRTIDVQFFGIAFLADDSAANLYSYDVYPIAGGGSGTIDRVDNGVINDPGAAAYVATPAGNHGRVILHIDADKVAATRPRFRLAADISWFSTTSMWAMELRQSDYPAEPAAAGWTSLACDRIGIIVRGLAAGGNMVCDIEAIRIYAE